MSLMEKIAKHQKNITSIIGASIVVLSLYSVAAVMPHPELHYYLFFSGSLLTWGCGLCLLDLKSFARRKKTSQFIIAQRQSGDHELWVRTARDFYKRLLIDPDHDRIIKRMKAFVAAEQLANPINEAHSSDNKCTSIRCYDIEGNFVSSVTCSLEEDQTTTLPQELTKGTERQHNEREKISTGKTRKSVDVARA